MKDVLVAELPLAYVENLLRDIPNSYREAREHLRGYGLLETAEQRNIEPHLRRGLIETKFRARALEAGLVATVEKNSTDTAEYTLVRAGFVELTHSKTSSENALPSLCDFRAQRSDANNLLHQAQLFPVAVTGKPRPVTYAILTHGPLPKAEQQDPAIAEVGFINIGFPSPDFAGWAEPPIDLRDIRDLIVARQQVVVDDVVELKLKDHIKKGIDKEKDRK